jgi:hypothetical protein
MEGEGMSDEIEISPQVVARMVQFILNAPTISPRQGIGEIAREARNANIGSKMEFYEATAKIIHLAREMLALERIDASFQAANHALAIPAPAAGHPTAPKRRRARKPRRGGQRDLFT